MRKTLLNAVICSTVLSPVIASAEDSPHTFTGNVGLYSQYIFRGLTQTNEEPAFQGGFDYSHSSGLYLGTWASNVSWLRDGGSYNGGGSLEWDFYGGFKNTIGKSDFTYDVGLLQYWYPGDQPAGAEKADTLEVYAGLGWKWFSVKYSYVISSKAFGVRDAKGTDYWDFGVSVPIGETGLTVGAHYGIQTYDGIDNRNPGGASNDSLFSYDDWRVTLAYDLGKVSNSLSGAEVGMMYSDTSGANVCGYGSTTQVSSANGAACGGVFPKNIADGQFTVWLKKTF